MEVPILKNQQVFQKGLHTVSQARSKPIRMERCWIPAQLPVWKGLIDQKEGGQILMNQ